MAVSAFRSTTRRQCDIRGVEEGPATPRSRSTTPTRRSGQPLTPRSRPSSPTRRSGAPSTPRSRPTTPSRQPTNSGERGFRRTRSSADLSSQYFSDSSTATGDFLRKSHGSGGLRTRSRQLPSDSEGEGEPKYLRQHERIKHDGFHHDGTQSARDSQHSNGNSSSRQPVGGLRRSASQLDLSDAAKDVYCPSYRQPIGGLRRSASQLELSDAANDVYYRRGKPASDVRRSRDDREGQVEEKTIRAVHTQTKVQTLCYNCLYDVSSSEVPSGFVPTRGLRPKGNTMEPQGELDAISMYDAMRAEVRRAVVEARNELEQSLCKDVSSSTVARSLSGKDSRSISGLRLDNGYQPTFADIQEYAAKLEQSERKAQELWSQLAVEEQRCLDLVKFVKELIPAQQDSSNIHQNSPSKMRDSCSDKDMMRESLDEEAQRYFEECVSIAKLDLAGMDDPFLLAEKKIPSMENDEPFAWPVETDSDSVLYNEDVRGSIPEPEPLRKSSNMDINSQALDSGNVPGKSKDCAPLGDEGMLLPWLDWEPEVDLLNRKEKEKKGEVYFRETKKAWARKSAEWVRSLKREKREG